MNTKHIWPVLVLLFVSLCLSSPATARKLMVRSQFAHTLEKEGWSGREDTNRKMGHHGLGYPFGRWMKVYSGGPMRDGWGKKDNTAGEGFWVMSNTGGNKHVSYAGNNKFSGDVISKDFTPADWPEAYAGVVEDEDYALAIRKSNGGISDFTMGVDLDSPNTNWWPGSGGGEVLPKDEIKADVGMIWNYRFGRYNSGTSFADRVAAGELAPRNPPAWAAALSEDDLPEQIGIQDAYSADTGIRWTRKWYMIGQKNYDDFIINDVVIENTSSATVEDVYINFQNRFAQQQAQMARSNNWYRTYDWNRDDHARSTMASNYMSGVTRDAFIQGAGKPAGLQALKDMADNGHPLLYYHDGESDHITNINPDVGDPYRYERISQRWVSTQSWIPEGWIQSGQYVGIGLVDAHPPFNTYGGADPETYVPTHDNPDTPHDESVQQPASITMWSYTDLNNYEQPVPFRHHDRFISDAHVYDTLTGAGYPDEPEEAYAYTHHMTYGPWTLAPGEKAKVVIAYVGGMAGDAPKYSDYKRYPQPFNTSWQGLWNGSGLGDVKFSERQAEIPLGEDAMQRHFVKAIEAYNWGYDVPNEPPSVKLTTKSNLQGQMTVAWSSFGEDSPDPDYTGAEAQDLRGYRVYRSSVQSVGPWELMSEFSFEDAKNGTVAGVTYDASTPWKTGPRSGFPSGTPLTSNKFVGADDPAAGSPIAGTYTFTDKGTKAGFSYWYGVRIVDSGHSDWKGLGAVEALESFSAPSAGAITGARYGVIPVVPGDAVFDNLEVPVKLVPNMWKVDDDLHTYDRTQSIRFTNLPARCRVDLYMADGQRFWTFHHDNVNQGEATYIQFTEARPSNFGESMNPGIYFWKVTSLMPESNGKTQMGTFFIIK